MDPGIIASQKILGERDGLTALWIIEDAVEHQQGEAFLDTQLPRNRFISRHRFDRLRDAVGPDPIHPGEEVIDGGLLQVPFF
jgi:hypothetical protein